MKSDEDKIRIRMLVPLGVLLATTLVIIVVSICWIQHKHIDAGISSRLATAERMFNNLLDQEARFMNGQIDFLKADGALRAAWLARDRQALLEAARSVFETMRSRYRVTHFYFIEPDKTCFLRVHSPGRHGDKKRLFILDRVVSEGKAGYGIELGEMGTFTLRVVHPWFMDEKLCGYMELGMEIEHLTPKLRNTLDAELLFVINKKYLARDRWEAGMEMMGRKGDWNRFADFALIDSTIATLPDDFELCLDKNGGQCVGKLFTTVLDGRRYRGGCVDLEDAGGRRVGGIIVLTDITRAHVVSVYLMVCLIAVATVLGGLLLTLCYFYMGKVGRKLIDNQKKLAEEIRYRRTVENRLRHSNNEMERRIEARTAQLAEANELLQAEIADHMKAQAELKEAMDQLKRFNDLAVGRELRMIELKTEINKLCVQLGTEPRYEDHSRHEYAHKPQAGERFCTENAVKVEHEI